MSDELEYPKDTERMLRELFDHRPKGSVFRRGWPPVLELERKLKKHDEGRDRIIENLAARKPSGRPRSYSDKILDEAIAMRKRGASNKQLARKIGCPETSVPILLKRRDERPKP